jgi:23S rRNA (guanosine2251-2'-O)-methyltransferase
MMVLSTHSKKYAKKQAAKPKSARTPHANPKEGPKEGAAPVGKAPYRSAAAAAGAKGKPPRRAPHRPEGHTPMATPKRVARGKALASEAFAPVAGGAAAYEGTATEAAYYACGWQSVLTLLEQEPQRVQKLWLAEGLRQEAKQDQLKALCKEHKRPWQVVPKSRLDFLMNAPTAEGLLERGEAVHHQGVVALVAPKALLSLQELLATLTLPSKTSGTLAPQFLVALDEVEDPRNLGALLRVLEGAGAKGLILTKHRCVGLTPSVSKTACGADHLLPVAQVGNLGQTLKQLKKEGFWIVGTHCDPVKSKPFKALDYALPLVLVLGNEAEGLRSSIAEACDFLAHIPLRGKVASLNVATAAAVVAFEIAEAQAAHAAKAVQAKALSLKP